MSSLRLALKLSMEENPNIVIDGAYGIDNEQEINGIAKPTKRKRPSVLDDQTSAPIASLKKNTGTEQSDDNDQSDLSETLSEIATGPDTNIVASSLDVDKISVPLVVDCIKTPKVTKTRTKVGQTTFTNTAEEAVELSLPIVPREEIASNSVDVPANESSPRYQSHRAAALVAKTKLTVKSAPRQESAEDDNTTAIVATNSKRPQNGSARKNKSAISVARLSTAATATGTVADDNDEVEPQYVACDLCGKWRTVPVEIDLSQLPEEWHCDMNTWDIGFNSCEIAQCASIPNSSDSQDEADTAPVASVSVSAAKSRAAGNKPRGVKSAGKRESSLQSGRKSVRAHDDETNKSADSEGSDNEGVGVAARGLARRRRQSVTSERDREKEPRDKDRDGRDKDKDKDRERPRYSHHGNRDGKAGQDGAGAVGGVRWVLCESCWKWRTVAPQISMTDLPKKWFCYLNSWSPAYSACTAAQEPDPTVAAGANDGHGRPGSTKKNGRALTNAAALAAANGGVTGGIGLITDSTGAVVGVKKTTNWVQCERKNCKKWRKLPACVDMNSLPDDWYCEMNIWDIDRSTCEGPEESDSDNEPLQNVSAARSLILANSKGPGALSYRRIIFGNDGKVRPSYSEKNKASLGLFTHSETCPNPEFPDEMTETVKKVAYWWSELYDATGLQYTTAVKTKPSSASAASSSQTQANSSTSAAGAGAVNSSQEGPQCCAAGGPLPQDNSLLRMFGSLKTVNLQADNINLTDGLTNDRHWPKKFARAAAFTQASDATARNSILENQQIVSGALKSCLTTTANGCMALPQILHMFQSPHCFQHARLRAVLPLVSECTVKTVLHALEEAGEVRVILDPAGVFLVQLVQHHLRPSESYGSLQPPRLRHKQVDQPIGVC